MNLRAVHDDFEVLLIGPAASLGELADKLTESVRATVVLSPAGNAWTYPHRLSSIVIVASETARIRIEIHDAELRIAGPSHHLRAIADLAKQLASKSPASHIHVEYYDGHPFLDPKSVPLVIARE